MRTPLVRLNADAPAEIWLKLECLQPVGSYKIRGPVNAIRRAAPEAVEHGVITASAGNMAQGVAWAARELGVPATIVVPDNAPETKLSAIERLGGRVVKLPFEEWWDVIVSARYDEVEGLFVHPCYDDLVLAGNGTIGLEILEDLPEVDAVVVPWGGGGLGVGIGSAIKALRPATRMIAAEPETGAPLTASLPLGEPVEVEHRLSFVDGAGSRGLLPGMWERAVSVFDEAVAVPLDDVAAAIRLLVERNRVVAEGAGALSVAAALGGAASGTVVCVVSGGNIDTKKLVQILGGETP